MIQAFFNINVNKILNKNISKYTYLCGISARKNNRKEVLHNKTSLYQTYRGPANKKSKKRASQTNLEIFKYIYKTFKIYEIAFSNKNPNFPNFVRSIQYLFDDNPKKFENAITANIKACLDKQKIIRNSKQTAIFKGFNKFAIDSRQLQMSFEAKRM